MIKVGRTRKADSNNNFVKMLFRNLKLREMREQAQGSNKSSQSKKLLKLATPCSSKETSKNSLESKYTVTT